MPRIAGVSPEETRAKLIEAASRVFALKGYEGSTVAEIAREAGATTGAIYTHFERKADLLVEAVRANTTRAVDAVLAPVDQDDPIALLVALAGRLVDRDEDEATLLIEGLSAARRDAEVAEVLAGVLAEREVTMTDLLAAGQASGALVGDVSARAAARVTLMLGLGSLFVRSLGLEPIDPSEWDPVIARGLHAFSTDPTTAPGAST